MQSSISLEKLSILIFSTSDTGSPAGPSEAKTTLSFPNVSTAFFINSG